MGCLAICRPLFLLLKIISFQSALCKGSYTYYVINFVQLTHLCTNFVLVSFSSLTHILALWQQLYSNIKSIFVSSYNPYIFIEHFLYEDFMLGDVEAQKSQMKKGMKVLWDTLYCVTPCILAKLSTAYLSCLTENQSLS